MVSKQNYILFDFDGTLADTFLLGARLINEYADKFGYARIDFEKNKDKSAKELIKMSHVRFWEIPRLLRFFRRETLVNANEICAFSGIPELIKYLGDNDFKMGIVSTNSRNVINVFLEKYNLTQYFSYFMTEVSLFGKKRALNRARRCLSEHYVVYVGDEIRDIDGAVKAKIPIISCAWGFNDFFTLQRFNSRVAKDCNDLKIIIEEMRNSDFLF